MDWPRSLSVRLALMFALVSLLLLGSIGFYLYQSLTREIAWRDDQMLLGRLERMEVLLGDGESVAALRRRPQLYANMLGNRESLLWILDAQGHALIEVNPANLSVPHLPDSAKVQLGDYPGSVQARLEGGFAQLSLFSEDLAHEMRTPLSNLLGHTQQVLRQERPAEDYQSLLASHIEEYERLSRMINSMLFLARTESPSVTMARESVDLGQLVEQLCEYFEGMAEEDDRKLINQTGGALWANTDLLRRALANLLANALRYGRSGTPISIISDVVDSRVVIRVHNAGEPIDPADQPRIFDRFYRCDPARTGAGDSGGLGLAIVRSIAQWHGGSVSVESKADGTTFIMMLPKDANQQMPEGMSRRAS